MQLTSDQVDRFYHIWFELLHYVHEQRHLAPNFPDTPNAFRKEEARRGLSHTTDEKYVSNIDAFGHY